MSKKKKSNLKDTSAEKLGGLSVIDDREFKEVIKEAIKGNAFEVDVKELQKMGAFVDPAQIDIEDQIKEEVKASVKPRFKNPDRRVKLVGNTTYITNDNLTDVIKAYLIDDNICSSGDFES